MDRVRSITLSGGVMAFTEPLDFTDSQTSFNTFLSVDPTMLRVTSPNKSQCATDDTEYLASKFLIFCNLCRLHIFCDSVQLKYDDMDIYDS